MFCSANGKQTSSRGRQSQKTASLAGGHIPCTIYGIFVFAKFACIWYYVVTSQVKYIPSQLVCHRVLTSLCYWDYPCRLHVHNTFWLKCRMLTLKQVHANPLCGLLAVWFHPLCLEGHPSTCVTSPNSLRKMAEKCFRMEQSLVAGVQSSFSSHTVWVS